MGSGCSPEPARVGVVGWEAVLGPRCRPSAPWRGPAGTFMRTARGARWGGQVAQVHREGALAVGARESWTVVAIRPSIERGIGCFCWVSRGGFGQFFFCRGCCRRRRLGVTVPGEPRGGQPAQVIDGRWKAVL